MLHIHPMLWYLLSGVVAAAAAVAAVLVLGVARRRYAALLSAVELCQRQLTELRSVIDREQAALAEVRTLIAETVAPGVSRLERARCLHQASRELGQAAARGSVDAEGAAALIEQLEQLEAEVLAGERGY